MINLINIHSKSHFSCAALRPLSLAPRAHSTERKSRHLILRRSTLARSIQLERRKEVNLSAFVHCPKKVSCMRCVLLYVIFFGKIEKKENHFDFTFQLCAMLRLHNKHSFLSFRFHLRGALCIYMLCCSVNRSHTMGATPLCSSRLLNRTKRASRAALKGREEAFSEERI